MPITMLDEYRPAEVEAAAWEYWRKHDSLRVEVDPAREKFYCLCMFPYPSGKLHMGHVRNYTIGDVISRFQRMLGKNVLQPMGWDAFGLPAENAAIQRQTPPAQWTRRNIDEMRRQLQRLGYAYDWEREIATCHQSYYKWEQWFFIKLFEKGLVYKKDAEVNWDPVDQTVLANEQVIDGKGWRSGAPVERRRIPQWFIRITDFAQELLDDLDQLEGWPQRVRVMQRNWIGRSEGLEFAFEVKGIAEQITVYTTRPDTIMGVACCTVAPQHPLALKAAEGNPEIRAFIQRQESVKVAEAELALMEKVGVDTGYRALHPISGEELPIWIGNFVLMSYGSGAVMSVPGHDQRDYEFAVKYGLPIKRVIQPLEADAQRNLEEAACVEKGICINSGDLDGLTFQQAFDKLAKLFEGRGIGRRTVKYRLRDWGVSRQRYWGAPIPMINCPDCGAVPVPEQELPVALPLDIAFQGAGSPLRNMPEFHEVSCPRCKGKAQRETDTFDTFMESSWYYARFACPREEAAMLNKSEVDYWLDVDQYIGGIEHAILHLLYARFCHKLLRNEGLVSSDEPFTRLLTQGMVLKGGRKMSKSQGNTVDPESMIDKYGADAVRLYIMFTSPPDQTLEWSDGGVEGAYRFLKRLWKLVGIYQRTAIELAPERLNQAQRQLRLKTHATIKKVRDDYERRQVFNTAIAAVMELHNEFCRFGRDHDIMDRGQNQAVVQEALEAMVLLLAPITPHICHVLWEQLGGQGAVMDAPWPKHDEGALVQETKWIPVQVNGKLRAQLELPADVDKEAIKAAALAHENVRRFTAGRTVRKIVVVPGRLANVVVS